MQKVESSRTGTWESIESIELSRSIASISTFCVHITVHGFTQRTRQNTLYNTLQTSAPGSRYQMEFGFGDGL